MECDSSKVHKIVALVRQIIEDVSPAIAHRLGFPHGWCDDCSRVLGVLLKELGEPGFMRVTGWRGEHLSASHVWLQRDTLIVDITADQFTGEGMAPVIVTTEKGWHNEWLNQTSEELEAIDFNRVEGDLYNAIKEAEAWHLEMTKAA